MNPLPIGTIIRDRFLVQSRLSAGGFGGTYLVRDQPNTRNNANLLVLKEVINPSRHNLYQITLDGMALRLLRHKALPHVYTVFSDAKYDRVYVLMDYIAGPSLEMLLLRQPGKRFSFPQAMMIMAPALSAVAYLHSQQPPVVHQDIKPATIIIPATRDKVMLVGFGVGKQYNLGSTTTSARHSLTPYEAPEQYDGEIDTRSDIYGLGAIFYTLLTGIVPDDALYRASKSVDPLEPMNQVVPAISMHVADAVHRAMSLSKNDRFSRVQQFEQALKSSPAWIQSPKVDLQHMLDLTLNAGPALQKPPDPLSHQSPLFTIEPSVSLQPQTEASEQAVVEPVVKSPLPLQREANSTEREVAISLQPETDSSEHELAEPIVEPPTPAQLEAHITEQESSGPMAEPSVSSESEVETLQQVSSEPPLESSPLSARVSKDAVGAQAALPLQQVVDRTTTRKHSAAAYTYEKREKRTRQRFPRFFQSRALLLIGLVLLLALGGVGSLKLLSLRQRSLGTTAALTSATHTPLATRTAATATPAPTTATPRNGLYIAGTYNGSMFDQTTHQLTYISVVLVQSEGNAALSGMVTFKSPSQGVYPLHGTIDPHGNFFFTVQLAAGQTPLYFYGALQHHQGSYLKGEFCRSSTHSCSVNTGYFLVGPRY